MDTNFLLTNKLRPRTPCGSASSTKRSAFFNTESEATTYTTNNGTTKYLY